MGQPGASDGTRPDGVNAALAPTGMRVRRDVAFSACDNWEAAGQQIRHPAGGRRRNRLSLLGDGGSSIELGWAAWPLIVGRWGWSDPGSDSLLSSIARCEPGEHLGDLVLAAEQRWGRGTVVVLGNDRPLTNEGLVRGHQLVTPLLDYLAHRPSSPNAWWRQLASSGADPAADVGGNWLPSSGRMRPRWSWCGWRWPQGFSWQGFPPILPAARRTPAGVGFGEWRARTGLH